MDHGLLAGGAEEAGPVDSVVVAQIAVVCDVDVASTDLLQGLELQGSDALLLQDEQGKATGMRAKVRENRD